MNDYRDSPRIFCADLFPAHRCSSAIKFDKTRMCERELIKRPSNF